MSGLYQSAEKDLQRLKTDYPASPALAAVNEVILPKDQSATATAAASVTPTAPAKPTQRTPAANQNHRAAFSLQVGAFSTMENAGKLKHRFEELGYPVEISNKVMERKTLYVVWVGAFDTADQARAEV